MADNLQLTKPKVLFDINNCIICQKNGGDLITTLNGRVKIMEASSIQKDLVEERLKSKEVDKPFCYHMNKVCYKKYTMKKTLDNLKVSRS